MSCNMGRGDRIFRGIVGIAVLGAGIFFQSWWGLIGLIPLVTSIVAWCPAYAPFGFNTGPKSEG